MTIEYQPLPDAIARPRSNIAAVRGARLVNGAERLYSIVCLTLMVGGLVPLQYVFGGTFDIEQGDEAAYVPWALVHAVGLVFALLRWKRVSRALRRGKLIVLTCALAFFSVLWSGDPGETLSRATYLSLTSLFGVYLAARFNGRELLRLVATAMSVAVLVSAAAALMLPSYGTDLGTHEGAWRGIYAHKNTLARGVGLGFVALLSVGAQRRRHRRVVTCMLWVAALVLVMARSTSSLLAVLAVLGIRPILRLVRNRLSLVIPLGIVVLGLTMAASVFLLSNAAAILGLFGKDLTLTGRTEVWEQIVRDLGEQPVLGFGYGAYWSKDSREADAVERLAGYRPTHSHNGYLEAALDLGLLGIAVFLFALLKSFTRSLRLVREMAHRSAMWPFLFICYFLIYNASESAIWKINNILWALFVAVTVGLNWRHRHWLEGEGAHAGVRGTHEA